MMGRGKVDVLIRVVAVAVRSGSMIKEERGEKYGSC